MANKGGTLLTRIENGVGHIAFSNPGKRNAISAGMLADLDAVLSDYEADDTVRVIALAGEGDDAFSSGLDIGGLADKGRLQAIHTHFEGGASSALGHLQLARKPTVALIRGFCFGAGVSISVLCDLRIASADASFSVPAARMGLGYSLFGVQTLAEAVGTPAAREILFTARRYPAAEALALGLINRVYPTETFQREAAQYLADLAAGAPLSIAAAKLSLRAVAPQPDAAQAAAVQAAIQLASTSEDFREGQRAFAEKRAPKFRGK